MTAVVIDTDVVSLIFKRHSLDEKHLDSVDGQKLLSFMTLAQLTLWRIADPGKRKGESGSANS